jgi:hypothetical protein
MAARDQDEAPRAALLGLRYDKIVFCRRLLLWSHVVLALIIATIFLSTRDYSHFPWWRRGAGSIQFFRVLIPMSPYALSGIWASRTEIVDLTRVYAFCVILALGTGTFGWIYISKLVEAFANWLDSPFYFALLMFCSLQAMVFGLAANILLDIEL